VLQLQSKHVVVSCYYVFIFLCIHSKLSCKNFKLSWLADATHVLFDFLGLLCWLSLNVGTQTQRQVTLLFQKMNQWDQLTLLCGCKEVCQLHLMILILVITDGYWHCVCNLWHGWLNHEQVPDSNKFLMLRFIFLLTQFDSHLVHHLHISELNNWLAIP